MNFLFPNWIWTKAYWIFAWKWRETNYTYFDKIYFLSDFVVYELSKNHMFC